MATDYEGFRLFNCSECGGHLVSKQRLEAIKRVDQKTQEELKNEIANDFTSNTTGMINCPRCKATMDKKTVDLPVVHIEVDTCQYCDLLWLDGGELALLQLAHQASRHFINNQELKKRMEELEASPERKARFEKNLANLPKNTEYFEFSGEDMADILVEILHNNRRRLF